MTAPAKAMAAAAPRPRPLYWSVRRELWEHRAVYLAPFAVEAVVLAAFVFASVFSSHALPQAVRAAAVRGATRAVDALHMPYAAAGGAAFVIGVVVAMFYALAAFNGERRDRSLLFWKSLPVSDLTTVAAKAAVPMVVQPLAVLAAAVATQLVMLAWSTAILLVNGVDPRLLWSSLDLAMFWVVLPYTLALSALWYAPIYGWLFLVSALARRAAFVWAVAPWPLLALIEYLMFRTQHVRALLDSRFFGAMALAFTVDGQGKAPIQSLSQINPGLFFGHPGLWGGLLFAVLCLAACVWLRRRHDLL